MEEKTVSQTTPSAAGHNVVWARACDAGVNVHLPVRERMKQRNEYQAHPASGRLFADGPEVAEMVTESRISAGIKFPIRAWKKVKFAKNSKDERRIGG